MILPKIGDPFPAVQREVDIYAGLTLHGNATFALVLLPGDFEGKWADAITWAKKQGGELPSRIDALLLWQNVPGHFKKEAYWTADVHASGGESAWSQYFDYGSQYYDHQDYKLRARAVRRVPIP